VVLVAGIAAPAANAGKIYCTNLLLAEVQRCNLDGSNVETLVDAGAAQYIALDVRSNKMYWTAGLEPSRSIKCATLAGSNVQTLVTLGYPWGIDLDLSVDKKIYWADPEASGIYRANLDGSEVQAVLTGLNSPVNIALDVSADKVYWTESGTGVPGKVRRGNLDGTVIEDLVTGLIAPMGIALDSVAGKVYWTDMHQDAKRIQRANLDGSNVQTLIVGYQPTGIALDLYSGKMYFADVYDVYRANLNGSGVELVTDDFEMPWGIALNVETGAPALTEWGIIALIALLLASGVWVAMRRLTVVGVE
jgi:DNA-binding beta-propeller fold protein YncE